MAANATFGPRRTLKRMVGEFDHGKKVLQGKASKASKDMNAKLKAIEGCVCFSRFACVPWFPFPNDQYFPIRRRRTSRRPATNSRVSSRRRRSAKGSSTTSRRRSRSSRPPPPTHQLLPTTDPSTLKSFVLFSFLPSRVATDRDTPPGCEGKRAPSPRGPAH